MAIGASVRRQVVVHDQDITSALHEPFANGGCRVGRDELNPGRCIIGTDHHDRVPHRVAGPQRFDHACDVGAASTDAAIDADHAAGFLVDDRIDGDRSFTGLAVAQDQLSLPPSDRDQTIDDLETRLQGNGDSGAAHDSWGVTLAWHALERPQLVSAIEWSAKRVDHASEQLIADGRIQHTPRSLNDRARLQGLALIQKDAPDEVTVQVECESVSVSGKSQQLVGLDIGKPGDGCNSTTDLAYGSGFSGVDLCVLSTCSVSIQVGRAVDDARKVEFGRAIRDAIAGRSFRNVECFVVA